ncbi:MAG: hypothetical protein K2L89_04905, partial [Muribaculaceae bacterium]|nr:hypothetical protein [Muribaculaceae bacterium]
MNSRNLLRGLSPLLFILLIATGCKKPVVNNHRGDAVNLYKKSISLIKLYTDSFASAQDSATLLELNERFESALTNLNFKFPAETCLEISEGENDTLTNLTERIIILRDSLLYSYAHPIEASDSLAKDSLS